MMIRALPAFTDNYIWMWDDGRTATVVDPGDPAPVLDILAARQLVLGAILLTHHHPDHTGGVAALCEVLQGPVCGPAGETIQGVTRPLADGDTLDVGGVQFEVLEVPGHTAGHIAYFSPQANGGPVLFCGDTLFSAGCGRLFEGTPAQMHRSLSRLAALPSSTRVFCTHEYTLSNLKFAQAVEPGNSDVSQYIQWCQGERDAGRPTLPSTVGREVRVNPFLRCAEPAVVDAAIAHGARGRDPVAVLAALREWKNQFR